MDDETAKVIDPILPQEAVQWTAWRLTQVFVIREAVEVCSTILRAIDPMLRELGYTKDRQPDYDILGPAWSLLDRVKQIEHAELASWMAAVAGTAHAGGKGIDIGDLLRHVQQASWALFAEQVGKYVAWESVGAARVWLGDPVLRVISRIVDASRKNAVIDNSTELVAPGYLASSQPQSGSVADVIRQQIEAACGRPRPDAPAKNSQSDAPVSASPEVAVAK